MFIQTESLHGDKIMRFYPGRTVLETGSAMFEEAAAAAKSPLAAALFAIDGVEKVFFDADYVAVEKADASDWQVLKPPVLGVIMEHFIAGRPIIDIPDVHAGAAERTDADEKNMREIQAVLDERVRPTLANQGGEIALIDYADGVARLTLNGAGFAQPLFAVKVKIENTLKNFVPGLVDVDFVHEPAHDGAGRAALEDRPGLATPEADAIQRLLDERINPAVAGHGGYISLVDVDGDRAFIRLEGGCQGCGMSNVTLSRGVEVEILREVPAIRQVVDVTDHGAGINPYYQPDPY